MSSSDSRLIEQPGQQNGQHSGVPASRARQGVTGHNVRYVLGFSLLGVIIALAVIWLIFFA